MLLYGPPGNGKTTVAQRFASVFSDVIYVPYAVMVEGQIIRVHDPSIHLPLETANIEDENAFTVVRAQSYDARWVPCQRPFVITGGELTLEMLDLRYDTTGHYYEAPLHVKALGGMLPDRRLRPADCESDEPAEPLDCAAGKQGRLSEAAHRQDVLDSV